MNYFEIHKNKKPKKLPKRKVNLKRLKSAVIMSKNILDIEIVKSCINMSIPSKAIEIAVLTLNTAKQITDLFSNKQKYLDRVNKK